MVAKPLNLLIKVQSAKILTIRITINRRFFDQLVTNLEGGRRAHRCEVVPCLTHNLRFVGLESGVWTVIVGAALIKGHRPLAVGIQI